MMRVYQSGKVKIFVKLIVLSFEKYHNFPYFSIMKTASP